MQADPRVFFALERTLLAWVRTGISIVGLGFVVSRFSLFLLAMAPQGSPGHDLPGGHGYSHLLGIALVLLGSVSMVVASIQHVRFTAGLSESEGPARYARTWSLWLSGLVTAASLLLAVYLMLTT